MADVLLILRSRRNRHMLQDGRNLWRARLKDCQNPFELTETMFQQRFRLSRDAVRMLIQDLKPYLQIGINGYSVEMQVLTTLRILGSGSFQNVVADGVLMQVSQASASRFVRKVTDAINAVAKKYITFPTSTGAVLDTCRGFHEKFGFPNVIGAIDCTHININKPSCPDAFVYMNRKSKYSINVQMVCDSNLMITDVVALWPGSSHDSYIWNHSGLKHLLSNGVISQSVFLLGDSGYPLEPWLLTPYLNPGSPSEEIFNIKHRRTRNIIERCFGILKSRFRALDDSGGKLLYDEKRSSYLIIAAVVLHNMCIICNMQESYDDSYIDNDESDLGGGDDDSSSDNTHLATYMAARILRDEIAARFQAAR